MAVKDQRRVLRWLGALLCCLAACLLLAVHFQPARSPWRLTLASPRQGGQLPSPQTRETAGGVPVNTGSVEALCALPGVGPALAQRIITERETNGPFAYAEDLLCVKGIGQKTLDKLLGKFCLD